MSDLDRYLAVPTGQDDVDPLVRDLREEQRHRASANIVRSGGNPDQAGRANQLSREFGLPPETVERNLPSVEDLQRQRKAVKLMERYPAIGSWSADPRNAAVGRDDLDNMGRVAKALTAYLGTSAMTPPDTRNFLEKARDVGARSLLRASRGVVGSALNVVEGLASDPTSFQSDRGRAALYAPITNFLRNFAAGQQASIDEREVQTGNWFTDQVVQGLESVLPSATGLLMAAATRTPTASLGFAGVQTQGDSFLRGREQGLGPGAATLHAVPNTVFEVAGEVLPVVKYIEDLNVGSSFFKIIGRQAVAENVGEQFTGHLQDFNDWATLPENNDRPFRDFMAERPAAALSIAIAATAATGVQVSAAEGARRGSARLATELGNRAKARQAEADAAFLDDLATGAAESKVRKRDPSAFARFLGMQAEGSPVENLYIPGDSIRELYQSNDMDWHDSEDPFFGFDPSMAQQIDQAIATGGDVVVKTADFATHLAGTQAWDALKDHVRASPDGMSLAEAREWEGAFDDAMNATGEEFAALVEADRAAMEPRQKLVEAYRDKLMLAGYRPDVAIANAELAAAHDATRAARLGIELTGTEADRLEVRQVLPPGLAKVTAVDGLDMVIAALKRGRSERSDSAKFGPSLLEFIAKRGGVEDRGGDIESMGGLAWHRGKVGRRKLIREAAQNQPDMLGDTAGNDNTPDALALAAWEAGYFPNMAERPSVDQFLEAVGQELGGRPIFAEDRTGKADEIAAAAEDLRGLLEQQGLDPDKASRKDIKAAVSRYQSEAMEGRSLEQGAGTSEIDSAWEEGGRGFIRLGETPQALIDAGLNGGGIFMGRQKIKRLREDHPDLPVSVLHDLSSLLADPLAILPSSDPKKADAKVVVIDARDTRGNPIIAALTPQSGRRYNVVLSVYGKSRGDAEIERMILAAGKAAIDSGRRAGRAIPDPMPGGGQARQRKPILGLRPKGKVLNQSFMEGPRGRITFAGGKNVIELYEQRDMSTFLHETGHLYLEELWADAGLSEAVAVDKQTVLDWFQSNGIAMPDDGSIPTEAHELWARGFERFAMEGKAPSSALRKAFDAFRSWLLTIYKVVDNLRSPISPEVRGVMERLLATDEEIAAAAEEQNIRALFTTAQEAGMTDEAFAEYQRAAGEARDEAHDALLYRTMASIRREKTKAWKEEEAGVRADVTERVDRQPLFRALRALTTGRVGDAEPQRIKLDRAWLVETYGPDALGLLPTRVPPIYAESGTTNADMIAEMTGFPTGDELVRTLMGLNARQKELREGGDKRSVRQVMIDEETASAMRERHGDPLNDGSIEDEARALIHNDKQGEVIASELRSLARRANKRPTPYAIARQWAAERIASGTVTETVSGAALARYERAARKAGKLAEEAMLAGDIDETYRQKQAQMLNNALIAEGKKAKDAVDKAVARLGKLAKRKTIKSIDQGHLDQVHALLEQVEFRSRSQRSLDRQESFEEWAASQQAAGFDVAVPPSFATSLGTTHWSRLTVEQLRGLDDTVKQIVHLGRLKQKLLDGQEQRAFDEMVDEAVAGMDGMPRKPVVDGFLDPSYPQKAWSFVLGLDAVMLKMETVFDWLDQGNPNGVFNRVIFQRFVDAQEQRRLRLKDMNAKLEAARQKIPEGIRKRWSRKVTLNLIDPETGRPAVMTGDQLIAMALNMGNEGNAKKLAGGYGWNEDVILAELDRHLTVEEWQYVQDVWDTIDTLWPDIEAMERRVNGVAPPKIEPRIVETKAGALKGGYYPVVYDPARNLEAERHAADDSDKLFANGYRRATTQAGSTHERTNVDRPILLSLSVISRHVGEVIHDITHREAVIDANRFLNNPRIVRNIRETLGVEVQKQMQPWLRHIANEWASDAMGTAALEKFIKGMRTNATFVGMAYRWSTIKMQVAGLFNSTETVGVRWIAEGVTSFSKNPAETTRFVMAASQEVAARLDNNDRDIRDAIKREQSRLGAVANVKIFGFHLIGYSDRFVSVVTWMGAYNRALSENMTEQQAVAFADKTVRRSQGSGAAKDLAAIQRGKGNAGEAGKLLTMFYSYMSAFYQRQRTLGRDFGKAARDGAIGDFPGLLARTMWLYFFPALASELLAGRGPDDDEDWTEWMLSNIAVSALGPLPVVRDVAGGIASGFGYNFTPASGIGRTAVNIWKDGKHIWEGEETKRATRNVMEGVGYVTGAVPGQLAASTQFLVDVAYGEQSPESVGDWWEGLTKGKIKED